MILRPTRFLLLSIVMILLLILLWIRVGYLQIVKHDFFKTKSTQQLRRLIKVYPQRGKIFDRDYKLLASVIPSYATYVRPQTIGDKSGFAKKIAPIIGETVQSLENRLSTTASSFMWLKRQCSLQQMALLKEATISGIGSLKTQRRYYPQSTLAAHVLGFVGIDNQGLSGLEYLYDTHLKGTQGRVFIEGDPRGFPLMSGKKQSISNYDGYHLITTLDSFIQFSAERHLSKGISLNDAIKGQVIVMNPQTGAILAMVSYPEMDANQWQKLPPSSRKNACIVDVYEPGSIFKPVTIASVLEEQIVTPGTVLTVPESLRVYDRTIHEAHDRPEDEDDSQTVSDILQKSLNVGTSLLAHQLGEEKQYQYMSAFGFGKKTGLKLPGESRGILRPQPLWSKVDGTMMSFGQGVAVTSLQMASAIACIANNGRYMQPRIINYIANADFTTQKAEPIIMKRQVIRPETARQVTQIMVGVVEHGTATNVKIPGYTIAGKTGTAQKAKENGRGYEKGKYIASFVGFFPVEDPKYLILVMVDSPTRSIWGSSVAGPIFRNIALDVINYFNIMPN